MNIIKIIIPLLLFVDFPGCSDGAPEPLIGKTCTADENCCEVNEEGKCDDGIYCDNSADPGQCLKLCGETTECTDPVLGDNNICVQFDFGGRCMRLCSNDEDCGNKTYCAGSSTLPDLPQDQRVCYPCRTCDN